MSFKRNIHELYFDIYMLLIFDKLVKLFVFLRHKANIRIRSFLIRNKEITIISNNCWGGFMYQSCLLKYNSPFIGLFIFAPDYIRLLENLKQYLSLELCFIKSSESRYADALSNNKFNTYPIGLLGDIEIHFLHYSDENEAIDKWNKRLNRIDFKNLLVKFSDRDFCSPDLIIRFDRLPFPNKVCFTAKPYPLLKSVVFLSNFKGQDCVENEWEYSDKFYPFIKNVNNIS